VPGAADLHVEQYGQGDPTVVLLHGFAGSARNFRPQARALRGTHRVVLFDARGHARSPAPGDAREYGPEAFVDDVHGVIESVGARSVVLGGLSMGAATALRYALRYPDALSGLVLASFPPSATSRAWARTLADAIEAHGLEAAGEALVWGGSRFDPAGAGWIRQGFLEHQPHALVAVLRQVLDVPPIPSRFAAALGLLRVPTLIVAGENDAPSLAASRDLLARIPGARLVVIAGAGHVVNLQKPESFNEALGDFLSEIDR
jgi:pimeloyl-ACP methyl ester carboxylesterase